MIAKNYNFILYVHVHKDIIIIIEMLFSLFILFTSDPLYNMLLKI